MSEDTKARRLLGAVRCLKEAKRLGDQSQRLLERASELLKAARFLAEQSQKRVAKAAAHIDLQD
jgi:hypothetical protein